MSGAEEQQGAVQEQTMAMGEFRGRITVFTITACSFCRRAMAKLKYLGLPFVAINLDEAPHRRAEMVTRTGGKTSVPQIFFNDMHLGGMDALEEAVSRNTCDYHTYNTRIFVRFLTGRNFVFTATAASDGVRTRILRGDGSNDKNDHDVVSVTCVLTPP